MNKSQRTRVLIAKIGLDGHDVGAKVLVQWLRDQGMEVIYTGLRQTPGGVVKAAIQEDVDVIGVSILSGSHLPIASRLVQNLKDQGVNDVLLLFGGIIPKEDVESLKQLGIDGIFPSHSTLEEIVKFINGNLKRDTQKKGFSSK